MAELSLRGLKVMSGEQPLLSGVDLDLVGGEILALVGASGSGKSLTARACLGILPSALSVTAGALRITVDGVAHHPLTEGFSAIQGGLISYLPQGARQSLDPRWSVGRHLSSVGSGRPAAHWLLEAGFTEPAAVLSRYPHELSGGMAQRVCIALALAHAARFLIADEPTTGLDAPIQLSFLRQLDRLRRDGPGILLITHDLGLVSEFADRIAVMEGGRIVEHLTDLRAAQTPTVQRMCAEVARLKTPRAARDVRAASAAVSMTGIHHRYRRGLLSVGPTIVEDASLTVRTGEVLGLIGESGSGKTTLARVAAGLITPSDGAVSLLDTPLPDARRLKALRRRVQVLFQSADAHLNPGQTVGTMLSWSARLHRPGEDIAALIDEVLGRVGLAGRSGALPHHLSGGERRRIGIARVLLARPSLLISDEPTTGLDAVLKADLLDLLLSAADTHLIISHDLKLIAYAADRIAVMLQGRIIEVFPTTALSGPHHPYTARLLGTDIPSEARAFAACPVPGPCPHATREGDLLRPSRVSVGEGHWIACYHTGEA